MRASIYDHNSREIWSAKNTPEENIALLAEVVSEIDRRIINLYPNNNEFWMEEKVFVLNLPIKGRLRRLVLKWLRGKNTKR